MLYTNLNEELYDIPIVFKNNVVQNSFDQFQMTLSGVGIEVFKMNISEIVYINYKNMLLYY